ERELFADLVREVQIIERAIRLGIRGVAILRECESERIARSTAVRVEVAVRARESGARGIERRALAWGGNEEQGSERSEDDQHRDDAQRDTHGPSGQSGPRTRRVVRGAREPPARPQPPPPG